MIETENETELEGGSSRQETHETTGSSGEDERVNLDNLPLEEKISHLINQPEVTEIIRQKGGEMLGVAIKFIILFPEDEEGLVDFLRQYKGHNSPKSEALLIRKIAEKLGLTESESEESIRKIYEYFYEKFVKNGYYFHGFNGAFLSAIEEHGLDPHERLWDWDEINEITAILRGKETDDGTHSVNSFFGSLHMNSEGLISIADAIDQLPQYSQGSPEWFNVFTGYALQRRDYKAARQNVVEKMSHVYDLNLNDKLKIFEFFDKYWSLFASEDSQPKCALIKKEAVLTDGAIDFFHPDKVCNTQGGEPYGRMASIFTGMHSNEQIKIRIPRKDLKIVDLPNYSFFT